MTASAKPGAAAETYRATLIRGSQFALLHSQKFFTAGKTVTVTAAEKSYLQQHAVDVISTPLDRMTVTTRMN